MSEDHSSICIGCGLCCDGTLHGNTVVKEKDIAAVKAAGLDIVAEGENRSFEQPCPRFSCGSCSVYAVRPPVCRGYRCALLRAVESGKTAEADARAKIIAAKELAVRIRSFDPEAVTPAKRSLLEAHLKQSLGELSDETRILAAEVLLNLGALEFLLEGWFRYRKNQANEPVASPTDNADLSTWR